MAERNLPADRSTSAEQAEDNKKQANRYKVLDVRDDDVVLELEDGRAFVASYGDKVNRDELKRNVYVSITNDGMDRSDAPKDAVLSGILPKE